MSYSNRPYPPDPDAYRRGPEDFRFEPFGPEEYELTAGDFDLGDDDYYDDGWRGKLRSGGGWLLQRLSWLGLVAVLSFGGAGIVAAASQSAEADNRPELTYGADQVLSERLDAGVRDLAILNDHVVFLGRMTRNVLSDLAQVNRVALNSDYQDGDAAVAEIDASAAALAKRLECRPWPKTRDADLVRTFSRAMVDRWHQVCLAIDSVAPLADDWASMENGARVAMQVADDVNVHDQATKAALQLATQGRYPDALAQLQTASAAVADAKGIDAKLAKVADVSTLTDWLTRTRTMDDALALLWQTMIDSKGRVTVQVTAALKAVSDATAQLPDNASVLQIVLYEMAGGLTSDGLSIEVAKGQLAAALADLTGGTVVSR